MTIKVTLLGTGTPYPSADRYGSAILMEAAGQRLLFDCGRGATIRLTQGGISAKDVDGLFLTHLHSDHVVGLPDLWLTGWFLGRTAPLPVWGPAGTSAMAKNLEKAYAVDLQIRSAGPQPLPAEGAGLAATDIEESQAYDREGVRVSAFLVDHGNAKPAFGYRMDYAGHAVAISGDTTYSENLIRHAKGVDCLIHAAWQPEAKNRTPPAQRSIASAEDVGRVFASINPKLAVVHHYLEGKGIAEAIRSQYEGRLVVARDLTVIEVGEQVKCREIGANKQQRVGKKEIWRER